MSFKVISTPVRTQLDPTAQIQDEDKMYPSPLRSPPQLCGASLTCWSMRICGACSRNKHETLLRIERPTSSYISFLGRGGRESHLPLSYLRNKWQVVVRNTQSSYVSVGDSVGCGGEHDHHTEAHETELRSAVRPAADARKPRRWITKVLKSHHLRLKLKKLTYQTQSRLCVLHTVTDNHPGCDSQQIFKRPQTRARMTQPAQEAVPFPQVETAHRRRVAAPGPRRQQEEKVLAVLMRVHPAAVKPPDEMRQLRLLHRCFLKWQWGIMTPHLQESAVLLSVKWALV